MNVNKNHNKTILDNQLSSINQILAWYIHTTNYHKMDATTVAPSGEVTGTGSYDDYYNFSIEEFTQLALISKIIFYLQFFFILFGTASNLMAIIVLVQCIRKKRGAMNIYLACVAFCDLIFVLMYSIQNITEALPDPIYVDYLTNCQLFSPGIVISSQMSALLIMMVTVNRFIAVYFPFKSRELQSTKATACCICVLVIVVLSFNWLWFGGIKPIDEALVDFLIPLLHCQGRNEIVNYYNEHIYIYLDITFYLIVPSCGIIIFNIAIICKIYASSSAKKGQGEVKVTDNKSRHEIDMENTMSTKVKSSLMSSSSVQEEKSVTTEELKEKRAEVYVVGSEINKEEPENNTMKDDSPEDDTMKDNTSKDDNPKGDTSKVSITKDNAGMQTSSKDDKKNGSKLMKKKANKIIPVSSLSKNAVRLTRICLVLSTSFLIVAIAGIINILMNTYIALDPFTALVYQKVTGILISLNHSINFLLYCVTSQTFRNDMKNMFCK